MKILRVKDMEMDAGGEALIAILNKKDASHLDLHPLDRVKVIKGSREETVVIDIAEGNKFVKEGSIGLFEEIIKSMNLKENESIKIIPAGKPLSLEYIKKKLDGHKLTEAEINQIVWDIVHNKLRESEVTFFVAACYSHQLSMEETVWLTKAMTSHGNILKINRYPIMDKHCVGGVAGNRTTMIVIPILAAAGLTIPKTSSRSITSPAGTADTVEVLTNVCLDMKKMKEVVEKTHGCMVWGGSLNLSPADDKIINVERPLSIDAESQLLASVMSKKASVSATHLLIDIPIGQGSKITHKREAFIMKKDFEEISKRLGIKAKVILTDGTQPIGNGIGPALEARDVLYILKRSNKRPLDLEKKSIIMAGIMLEMGKKANPGKGIDLAKDILESGKAYTKFIEIVKAQGGKEIQPEKIAIGRFRFDKISSKDGKLHHIDNRAICKIARVAGAPEDKGAGIYLNKHVNDSVKKGEIIFSIYSQDKIKLDFAKKTLEKLDGFVVKNG